MHRAPCALRAETHRAKAELDLAGYAPCCIQLQLYARPLKEVQKSTAEMEGAGKVNLGGGDDA